VWIAANDRGRPVGTGRLGDGCLDALPQELVASEAADAIRLIDVIWLDRATGRVAAAFEVEHTTSIHSGIVRMLDLVAIAGGVRALFLVAPDDREDEVRAQLARPAFRQIATLDVRYLSYGELSRHRESIARFGTGLKGIEAIARRLA
jgi:type II restriction enzyme